MERIEIFKQLLETEKTARVIYDEAEAQREGLSQYLDEKVAALRAEAMAEADAEIARAEELAVQEADAEIARQNRQVEAQMAAVRDRYERGRDSWARRVFDIAVHRA